ncbi:MAG: helix-hairpin-helix domain-containing protein, partial [Methanosarcinales archaeon]
MNEEITLEDLLGIESDIAEKLKNSGFDSIESIAALSPNELATTADLDETTASEIINAAKNAINKADMEVEESEKQTLEKLLKIRGATADKLRDAGLDSIESIAALSPNELATTVEIGESTASKIINTAKKAINKEEENNEKITIEDLPGVGNATADKLRDAGFESIESIAVLSPGELAAAVDIGESTASKIINAARKAADIGGFE